MQRDLGLDYLKGVGCLSMIVAHMPNYLSDDLLAHFINFVASFGMIYFFSASGVTAAMPSSTSSISIKIKRFAFIALYGCAWNIVVHGSLRGVWLIEMLQIIAIGSVAVLLTQTYIKPGYWFYFVVATILLVIKFVLADTLGLRDASGLVLVRADYTITGWPVALNNLVITGYPILPWISLFFAGVFCYRCPREYNLYGLVAIACLCIFATILDIDLNWGEKWDMSVGYALLSYSLMFLSFYIARNSYTSDGFFARGLLFLGKNSLKVVFAHGFGLVLGVTLGNLTNYYFGWSLAIAVTFLLVAGLNKINVDKYFMSWLSWSLLAVALFTIPVLHYLQMYAVIDTTLNLKLLQSLGQFIALLCGLLFAIFQANLGKLLTAK